MYSEVSVTAINRADMTLCPSHPQITSHTIAKYLVPLRLTVLHRLHSDGLRWTAGPHGRISHHVEGVGRVRLQLLHVELRRVVVHCKLILHVIEPCWKTEEFLYQQRNL